MFAFPVTVTKDEFLLSKIWKKIVLSLSCVSCFPRLSLLVWIILHFLYRVDVLGKFRKYLVVFSFLNSVLLEFWVHMSCE